jgi:hypothetical protein
VSSGLDDFIRFRHRFDGFEHVGDSPHL